MERNNTYYQDKFFDFSYIRCLNLNSLNDLQEMNNKQKEKEDFQALFFKSFLYNNYDSYYTERGHKIIDEIDPLSNHQMLGTYLPIILIGSPGAGKSTFINIINGTRISKATSSEKPVTSKSAYYDVKIPGQNSNEISIPSDSQDYQEAFFRFIDTPGFDVDKDTDIALNEIKTVFKNFKDGKEKIPIILYFINSSGRNFGGDDKKREKTVEILKLISQNKAKIIFVITHIEKKARWKSKGGFKKLLSENGLELVEPDDSNITYCDLVGSKAYGIQDIFKKIYSYLNILKDDEGKSTGEVYTENFREEIKKLQTFDEKLKYMKEKTHMFDQFESKEDILKYGNKKSNILLASMMISAAAAGSIPIAFADNSIIITIIGNSIVKIGQYYGYVWKNINRSDLKAIYEGKLYDPNEADNISINDNKEISKIVRELLLKSLGTMIALNMDDFIKSIWGIGTTIGVALGVVADAGLVYNYLTNAKKYFESKCKADDGTIFFTTRCMEYEIIFQAFKNFENYELVYPSE